MTMFMRMWLSAYFNSTGTRNGQEWELTDVQRHSQWITTPWTRQVHS